MSPGRFGSPGSPGFAGVAWDADSWEVAFADGAGRATGEVLRYPATATDAMIARLLAERDPLTVLVESTDGILDGRLMAAGITVRRADPGVLPARPDFGSAPAGAVARTGADPAATTPLERHRGTQTGREALLERWIASGDAATRRLAASGRLLHHGPRERPEIALTFDDGPVPVWTGRVLDVLERYQIPATFFCVGMYAAAYPDEIRRIKEQGHALANHTWSHPFLPELTRPQLLAQLERTRERIAEVSGGPPPELFRPPYGARTPEVLDGLDQAGARVVLWDVAPDDWAMPGADVIARRVLAEARPGSVVLLHDGGGDRSQTVAALPAMIEGLLARGHRFVRVDEMTRVAGPV